MMTGTIREILQYKGKQIWSISPAATVYDAIALMSEKNVGALPVMDTGKLVGIISERDYSRKIILMGRSSRGTRVEEILSSELITVTPTHTVDECMRLMTHHRIRHLPVLEGDQMVGMISIGDLVNWIINVQRMTIDQLQNYISGQYPG
jgi:CBS domain-containing protein